MGREMRAYTFAGVHVCGKIHARVVCEYAQTAACVAVSERYTKKETTGQCSGV